MKALAGLLVAASVAFCIFSIAYGNSYGSLRDEYSRAYRSPNSDQIQRRVDAQQDSLHSTVKIVSLIYFLLCLGFFVGVLKTTRRAVPIIGIVVCVVMLAWSLILSSRASFDEIYPAWVVAAILLGIFQLVTLGSRAKPTGERAVAG